MLSVKTLPLLSGAKFIIIDEGLEAMYGRTLIAGWLEMWKGENPNHTFQLFSFSDPKSWYENEAESFKTNQLEIYDCYTLDTNEIYNEDFDTLQHILNTFKTESTVIVDCLSSLIIYVGLTKALWFLERLSGQVPQLICIYRRDFVQNKVPCVETLGTTYVKLVEHAGIRVNNNFTYIVQFMHRKMGITMTRQTELVTQDNVTYEITSEKIESRKKVKLPYDYQKQKVEYSFRIELDASEMKERDKTALPYTIKTDAENTSTIHYRPDDEDDIDEEDPDDDLCI